MKMIPFKCLPSRAMHHCSRNVKLRITEICNSIDCEGVAHGAVEDLLRPSIENSAYLQNPINGNGPRHYRVDGQVELLPTSSRKQPAFHASNVLEVPGPSLFCMEGILSPDVKFSAHYSQISPRRVHV